MRLLIVFGTRPEAIKVAPIIMAARKRDDIEVITCSTGQHREMLAQVTDYFGIVLNADLRLMQSGQTLTALTARCVSALGDVVAEQQPDLILGQGDTTTAMCAGLVAFMNRIPFVHVEAGLRTDSIHSPFPEEFNRRVCSQSAWLHCAPTETAAAQLRREGYDPESVVVTGNTVIDALQWTVDRERNDSEKWQRMHPDIIGRRTVLITSHRRENHGAGLHNICSAVRQLSEQFRDVQFVWPVHPSPKVSGPVHAALSGLPNVHLIPPASYPEFVWLMDQSTLILGDSGGVQEEAPSLRKPVLVTRGSTERPEVLEAGATRLVGTDIATIVEAVTELLTDRRACSAMRIDENPYGDGHAADAILDRICDLSETDEQQINTEGLTLSKGTP